MVMAEGDDARDGRAIGELFSYVDLEQRVRADHPLRAIREVVALPLAALSGDFAELCSGIGRPSIAPEMLLRAMLLQAFYSIRSERQLMERLEFDLLFRWFVGLGSMSRCGIIRASRRTATGCWMATRGQIPGSGARPASGKAAALERALLGRQDLDRGVGGMKSFEPSHAPVGDDDRRYRRDRGCNAPADFEGEKRSNATHTSTTDPDALLSRKGPGMEAELCFISRA